VLVSEEASTPSSVRSNCGEQAELNGRPPIIDLSNDTDDGDEQMEKRRRV